MAIYISILKSVVVFCSLFLSAVCFSDDWTEIYKQNSKSIALVFSRGSVCSGGLISNRHILTAYHCVSYDRPVTVAWIEDFTVLTQAKLVAAEPENDIAILELAMPVMRTPIPVMNEKSVLSEGQNIATIGHPMSVHGVKRALKKGHTFVLSTGVVSRVDSEKIITDMAVNPGNSGGPVFDSEGKIVGVVSAKLIGAEIDNIGYFIPYQKVRLLYQKYLNEGQDDANFYWPNSTAYFSILSIRDPLLSLYEAPTEGYGLELGLNLFDRVHFSWVKDFRKRSEWGIETVDQLYLGYQFMFQVDPLSPFFLTPSVSKKYFRKKTGDTDIFNVLSLKATFMNLVLAFEHGIESDSKLGMQIGLKLIGF